MSPWRAIYAIALVAMVGFLGWWAIAAELERRAPPFEGTAAERLSRAPLDGDAFADLAVAMRALPDQNAVLEMHEIASRRDPRDLRIRAWLVNHFLRVGAYPAALEHLDVILRLSPEIRPTLTQMMAGWADDQSFAAALAAQLRHEPIWLNAMLTAFRHDVTSPGASAVFLALRDSGDLNEAQTSYWLDALMSAGRWDEARRYWASGLPRDAGEPVPLVYNGSFEQPSSQQGFDWRTGRQKGSYTEFEATEGSDGQAAHMVFSGRPVDLADIEQALAMAAGDYVLSMRLRAVALRSDQGLRWIVICHGQSRPIAQGGAIEGTFEWRPAQLTFSVPESGCPGQWLRLDNPAPQGSASSVSGDLWVDDVELSGPVEVTRSSREP